MALWNISEQRETPRNRGVNWNNGCASDKQADSWILAEKWQHQPMLSTYEDITGQWCQRLWHHHLTLSSANGVAIHWCHHPSMNAARLRGRISTVCALLELSSAARCRVFSTTLNWELADYTQKDSRARKKQIVHACRSKGEWQEKTLYCKIPSKLVQTRHTLTAWTIL